MLQQRERTGYIQLNNKSALFSLLEGDEKQTLECLAFELPKANKNRKQAVSYGQVSAEIVDEFLHKVATHAAKHFITGKLPNINSLVLTGQVDMITYLLQTSTFDSRLKGLI